MGTTLQRLLRAATPPAGGAALIGLYLWMSDLLGGFMLRCPLKWLTGFDCPGCGSQRALRLLMEGDVWGAARVNLLIPVAMIYLGVIWVGYIWKDTAWGSRLRERATAPGVLWVLTATVIGWWVIRNIAGL